MENEDPKDIPGDEIEEESFAELFESYSKAITTDLRVGDKIEGRIIAIGKDSLFIDTGTKIDGVAERNELLDDDGELPYKEGDTLELFVVSKTEGEIRLSKAVSGIGGEHMLREAFEGAIPVEGRIQSTCKGGFNVEILKRRAFCPISQIDVAYVEDPEPFVGQTLPFLITRLEERGKNIVLSRRVILEEEQEKVRKAFFEKLTEGEVLDGTITRLMPYGAFVELVPSVEGMAHISELSWTRLDHPQDAFQPGQAVKVKVLGLKSVEGKSLPRIALSVKQVEGNPWDTVIDDFKTGDKINGRVTRCQPFGAFVEIAPGIEGLVHISEMSYLKRVLKPEDEVTPGESVFVMIKDIDTAKRRISLSMKDAEGDPWADVSERFTVGQKVKGQVERVEGFGYFIRVAYGITGLMPKSKIAQSQDVAAIGKLKSGDSIDVMVAEIKAAERRMTLAPADAADANEWREFTPEPQAPMGSLAEKLQQALAAKNKKN
jgi:small subunit ribosomal protein S1